MSINYYNIGAGAFRYPGWINVDHWSEWYRRQQGDKIGIDWDLLALTSLPIKDGTAEIIYSSHVIEHVTNEAALNMFKEVYRALKVGGVLRIVAPNIDIFYEAYRKAERSDAVDRKTPLSSKVKPLSGASVQQILLWQFATNSSELHIDGAEYRISDDELDNLFGTLKYEEALDWCVSKCSIEKQRKYPGNHMNWWNEDKATNMLTKAGFNAPYVSSYGKSCRKELQNTNKFDATYPKISFFIEAVR